MAESFRIRVSEARPTRIAILLDSARMQPPEPLPSPERRVLYNRLVDEHRLGARTFKSVASFHAAYLELGGTPRKKSVGKDRLNAGVPIGRKKNRRSIKERVASTSATVRGTALFHVREKLYPSDSKTNRHGKDGQCSLAACNLRLPLGAAWTRQRNHRLNPLPPGGRLSKGGRKYVKVCDRVPAAV